ncbi:hypothetical protein FACS189446_4000 [Bacteroidia bacterium]|nr:hypothetical protein FACS189446_4000 [Bacteroidia bacterium]
MNTITEKMNRIILIGNGFDLAHGLETSYKHFIDDLCKQIKSDSDMWNATMAVSKPTNVNFDELIKNESNFANKFLCALKTELNIQDWVDVEKVYYKQLVKCMEDRKKLNSNYSITDLNREFGFFERKLQEYLLRESGNKNSSIKTIKSIETYLDKLILEEDKTGGETETNYNKTYIVNFNYTSTDEKYKDKIDKEDEIIRLHGELNNPKNPMIFGYGDELAKQYDEIQELDDNRYLEYVKSIKYSLTDNYSNLWSAIKEGEYHIYLFGLSCGNSDRTLLNELFEDPNCKRIKIFYWQKPDMSDDYLDTYKNISRIFKNKNNLRTIVATKPKSKALAPVSDINKFLSDRFVLFEDNGHKFWISKYLVTQGQYESIMGSNPSYFKGEKLPVESVNWYDAAEFCNRLSAEFDTLKEEQRYIGTGKSLKEDTTKKGFRLPKEAEWIYAAKHCRKDGTETTEFAGTNDEKELKNYAWYYENSGDKELDDKEWDVKLATKNNCRTHEVGTTKKADELKIHDMSGNVWERCEDWHDENGSYRVLRGGSWDYFAEYCRVSIRYSYTPTLRSNGIGFRLVLPL